MSDEPAPGRAHGLRIILLSISEWYYGRVLLPEIVATLAGYAGCNENFVLLTTGITGVLSFEL